VASAAARVLSCGSRFMFGANVGNYLLYWWMSPFVSEKLPGVGGRGCGFGLPDKAV